MYIYLYTRVTCASITSVALQQPCPDPSAIPPVMLATATATRQATKANSQTHFMAATETRHHDGDLLRLQC